jgi:hypothetical protein
MRMVMGIIRGPNGIYYARKKVPDQLGEAVARVTNSKAARTSWLKRSLRTRDPRQANIVGKAVLMEFDQTLAKAKALLKPLPVRDIFNQREVERMADYFYASKLTEDEEIRQHGTGYEQLFQAHC